jgi:uncharacterized surface protein with fasciclin (FAS1) repeats
MLRNFRIPQIAVLAAAMLMLLSACRKQDLPFSSPFKNSDKKSIAELVKISPRHNFLYAAVVRAGLASTLSGSGTFTVFAPTDDAFKAAGFPTIQSVKNASPDALKNILLYHALGSVVYANDVQGASALPVKTLADKDFYVSGKTGKVWVNNATVTVKDIKASNGVIHVIDVVLIPPSQNLVQLAQSNPDLSILVAAVLKLGEPTVSTLASGGPFTVLAPTNEAFEDALVKLDAPDLASVPNDELANILSYHLIPGRVFSYNLTNGLEAGTAQGSNVTFTLNGGAKVKGNSNTEASNIVAVDILATNGVVHVIDQVLLP